MPILDIKNIRKDYLKGDKKIEALRGVTLAIEKGEFLSIVGPSGSGKSTLLNIVGCLDTPTSGSVLYNGKELGNFTERQLSDYRRDNIAFIFQSYNLIPVLSVRENVELPLVIERKYSKAEMARKAIGVIESVGLGAMADRLPRELSGGQEQRVAIARALVKEPLVVLADEPTANLDSSTAEDVISIMEKMNSERATTFVFSTHDLRMERHAKRIVTLRDGGVEKDERR
ncbi:MAG TPA: ABC transporter ATP-binding protein [Chitinivibrionales bacterium]|nr:ABC transporter ATP-binding protein [Chitinivibrionales bacterium]